MSTPIAPLGQKWSLLVGHLSRVQFGCKELTVANLQMIKCVSNNWMQLAVMFLFKSQAGHIKFPSRLKTFFRCQAISGAAWSYRSYLWSSSEVSALLPPHHWSISIPNQDRTVSTSQTCPHWGPLTCVDCLRKWAHGPHAFQYRLPIVGESCAFIQRPWFLVENAARKIGAKAADAWLTFADRSARYMKCSTMCLPTVARLCEKNISNTQ